MNPYTYIKEATDPDKSLLSLCCGVGLEFQFLQTPHITAVDLSPQYIEVLKTNYPKVNAVLSDALKFVKSCKDNSYNVISIIDGIEHMPKETGLALIPEMKRVCSDKILLFTPQGPGADGFLKNEPHNAWGVEGADHFQLHQSGWTADELQELGFTPVLHASDVSQHGEPYTALMYEFNKVLNLYV